MEAIVSLGTTIQAGSSLPPGCKQRGFFVPRNVSPTASSVSVAYGRLGAEHQQRLAVSGGARGRKNAISERSTPTAPVPLFLRSDAAVAAEHPKLAEPFIFAKDVCASALKCHLLTFSRSPPLAAPVPLFLRSDAAVAAEHPKLAEPFMFAKDVCASALKCHLLTFSRSPPLAAPVPLFLRSDAAVAAEHPKLAEPFMFAKDVCASALKCHLLTFSRSPPLAAPVPLFLRSDAAAVAAEHPKLAEPFIFAKDIRCFHHVCHCQQTDQETAEEAAEVSEETWGVQIAIAVLRFYKREISSLLPGSCRYVPTCSEYSMQAYRTYGVLKGTVLTAWRLARCNPFGGSGFDPPRWFGESKPPPF